MLLKKSLQDIPFEIIIEIIEWMSLDDSKVLCSALGQSQTIAFRYHQFHYKKKERFNSDCVEINRIVMMQSDYFNSICQNAGFNKVFSDYDKLMIACELGYDEQIKILLNKVDPGLEDNRPLRICCARGRINAVKILLSDQRVDPSAMQNFPLLVSSLHGYTDIVRILIADPRVSLRVRHNAVVVAAAQTGHAEIVKILLSNSSDYCVSTLTEAMKSAHYRGHVQVVQAIAQHLGVDPSQI